MSFVLGESNLSHGTWDTILNNKLAHERKPFLSYPYAHSSHTIFLSSISQVKPKEAIFVFACYDQGFMFILLSSTYLFLWICNLIVLNHDFDLIVVTGITSFLEQTSLIISLSDLFRKLISRHKPTKSAQLEDPFCSTFLFAKKSKNKWCFHNTWKVGELPKSAYGSKITAIEWCILIHFQHNLIIGLEDRSSVRTIASTQVSLATLSPIRTDFLDSNKVRTNLCLT